MTAPDDANVIADVLRSPLHNKTWVPFVRDTEHFDSVYAGPLRDVKAAVVNRVQRTSGPLHVRWFKADRDQWSLEVTDWDPS